MKSYKKIGLSHEMGLIDTPPLSSGLLYSVFGDFLILELRVLAFSRTHKTLPILKSRV